MFNKLAVIVDDDQLVLSLISDLAELAGFSVKTFQSPSEALSYIKQYDADVILTDYKMPVMDGLALTREIRKTNSTVPILMITAEAVSSHLKQAALESGVNNILSKPVKFAEFDAVLQNLFEWHRAE